MTTAKGQALASAAILRPSDLPGYSAKPQSHTASDVATENAGRTCLGLGPTQYLSRNFGMAFSKGEVEIDSSADVAFSATQAMQELRALSSSKGSTCAKEAIRTAITGEGLNVQSFSAVVIPVSVTGADATFGYKYSVAASGQGQELHLAGYEVGALVGQVEIDVTAIGTSPLPVTLASAEHLAAIAASRVRAAE